MSAKPVLAIEGLSLGLRSGGWPPLLEDLSLEVAEGETVCLVGESGSGKSLTALATMGLLSPSIQVRGGSIRIDGRSVLDAGPSAMRRMRASSMGMIFQEPMTALNPVVTVGTQIDEVLVIHGRQSKRERRAEVLQVLDSVNLPDPAAIYDTYPHQLSGGQRQRAMIAMALVLKPRILIADEPTTALDVTTQRQILSLIKALQTRNRMGVLFITHDMGVVADIADRVIVLRNGRTVEQGPVEQILRAPAAAYTRELLQSVPSLIPAAQRAPVDTKPVLEVSGLSKHYGGGGLFRARRKVAAAVDVGFAIQPGRTLGIVGESGSGKSTVARCIMRLLKPDAGRVTVAGEDIAGRPEKSLHAVRRHIQLVFQDPYRSLNPRIPVGESVIEGLTNYGTDRAAAMEQARALLDRVGLPADAVSRYPHEFSGGQRQRIAIARALALSPQVIVADEAVSALDVVVQKQVLDLLRTLQDDLGIAMLFITHDLRVAAQVCDDILVMQSGQAVEFGAAAEILRHPRHRYTRELIDAAPGKHWDFAHFRPIESEAPAAPRA